MSDEKIQMSDIPRALPGSRPVAITIICVLGIVGIVLSIIPILLAGISAFVAGGMFVITFIWTLLMVVLSAVAISWMWKMKRKGAYLYTGLFIAAQIFLLVSKTWGLNIQFFSGLVVCAISLYYLRQMK